MGGAGCEDWARKAAKEEMARDARKAGFARGGEEV